MKTKWSPLEVEFLPHLTVRLGSLRFEAQKTRADSPVVWELLLAKALGLNPPKVKQADAENALKTVTNSWKNHPHPEWSTPKTLLTNEDAVRFPCVQYLKLLSRRDLTFLRLKFPDASKFLEYCDWHLKRCKGGIDYVRDVIGQAVSLDTVVSDDERDWLVDLVAAYNDKFAHADPIPVRDARSDAGRSELLAIKQYVLHLERLYTNHDYRRFLNHLDQTQLWMRSHEKFRVARWNGMWLRRAFTKILDELEEHEQWYVSHKEERVRVACHHVKVRSKQSLIMLKGPEPLVSQLTALRAELVATQLSHALPIATLAANLSMRIAEADGSPNRYREALEEASNLYVRFKTPMNRTNLAYMQLIRPYFQLDPLTSEGVSEIEQDLKQVAVELPGYVAPRAILAWLYLDSKQTDKFKELMQGTELPTYYKPTNAGLLLLLMGATCLEEPFRNRFRAELDLMLALEYHPPLDTIETPITRNSLLSSAETLELIARCKGP